jgi:cytochrome c oxidase subunit II
MRMQRYLTVLAPAILLAGLAGAALARGQAPSSGYHEFKMTAKNWEFDPNVITVKKGEKVRLFITAFDHNHGFKIPAYDIDQMIPKGSTATIEFTADKAGTFEFKCSVYCGKGHRRMKGTLVVEE